MFYSRIFGMSCTQISDGFRLPVTSPNGVCPIRIHKMGFPPVSPHGFGNAKRGKLMAKNGDQVTFNAALSACDLPEQGTGMPGEPRQLFQPANEGN